MHIQPTREQLEALRATAGGGPVVMLNLLRFRNEADYSASPELAPAEPISGSGAYRRYEEHVSHLLSSFGGELVFAGHAQASVIGPEDEQWDVVLLVRYPDVETFLRFTNDEDYLAGVGHRTAALEDSRLVPLTQR
ncbi:MAG: DUF1330 domain-containing protein [Actinobacteria bacterium]|nr:DUF1330 domain-containing protein [Actinomycetota bacterium]